MAYAAGTISSLCKQMEREGAAEGSVLRPDSNAAAPDLHEVRATMAARQCATTEEAVFGDALVAAERQSSEITQHLEALDAACASHLGHQMAESAFSSTLAKHESGLVATCAAEMEARAALNGFRSRNGIHDPARYPEDRLFHFSLLILFIVIETGVNTSFYQSSSGMIGSAVIALSVSVINMGIAAVLGALFRYANLPETKFKVVGYGALALFVVTGLVMNLVFATFRVQHALLQARIADAALDEASTMMLVDALRVAFVDALGVFQLQFPAVDFLSFTMFFVGAGCSAIAFWKGYTFDDKYPGHGDMDRHHKAAESAFKAARAAAFDAAMDSVRQMADEVEQLRNRIIAEQRNACALKAQVQSAHAGYLSVLQILQSELRLVIETYRATNRATRTTTAPRYFSDFPSVAPDDDGASRVNAMIARIEEVSAHAKSLADTRATILAERLILIRQKLNELVEQAFQQQMSAVIKRAEDAIASRGQQGA